MITLFSFWDGIGNCACRYKSKRLFYPPTYPPFIEICIYASKGLMKRADERRWEPGHILHQQIAFHSLNWAQSPNTITRITDVFQGSPSIWEKGIIIWEQKDHHYSSNSEREKVRPGGEEKAKEWEAFHLDLMALCTAPPPPPPLLQLRPTTLTPKASRHNCHSQQLAVVSSTILALLLPSD